MKIRYLQFDGCEILKEVGISEKSRYKKTR